MASPTSWGAAAAAVLLLLLACHANAEIPALEQTLSTPTLGDGSISPDGRWAVYEHREGWKASTRFDLSYWSGWTTSELRVVDLASPGRGMRLLDPGEGRGHVLGPWSPSGARLLIYRLADDRFEAGIVDLVTRRVRWTGLSPDLSAIGATAAWADDDTVVLRVMADPGLPWLMRQYGAPTSTARRWAKAKAGRRPSSTTLETEAGVVVADQAREPTLLVSWSARTGETRRLSDAPVIDFSPSPDGRTVALILADAPTPLIPDQPLSQSEMPNRGRLELLDMRSGAQITSAPDLETAPHLLAWRGDSEAVLVWTRSDAAAWSEAHLTAISRDGVSTRFEASGLAPLAEGEIPDLYHGVSAAWLGATPILYAREKGDQRFDWWRLGRAGPVNLSGTLAAAPRRLGSDDGGGFSFVAEDRVWRLSEDGRLNARPGLSASVQAPDEGPRLRILGFGINGTPRRDWIPIEMEDRVGVVTAAGQTRWFGQASDRSEVRRVLAFSEDAALMVSRSGGADQLWVETDGPPVLVDETNPELAGGDGVETLALPHLDPEGRPVLSRLYLPPASADGIKGVIVSAYPDDTRIRDRFAPGAYSPVLNPRVVASLGYAWLYAAAPILEGSPDPIAGLPEDLNLAIAAARSARPEAPWERAVFFGHSFGGYAALRLAAADCDFAGIIASSATSDLISKWGVFAPIERDDPQQGSSLRDRMGWVETGQADLGGPPWARLDRYLAYSPALQAEKVDAPILLITGDRDFVSMTQSEQMFSALHRLGKSARLLTYWGEGHFVLSPANQRDLYDQVADWLEQTLGGAEPDPASPSTAEDQRDTQASTVMRCRSSP